ncbi:MAG: serine hydrolase [Lachnospiraceae bacterium]|nr:serine hydrolase [Lachnospiraceae bacterium]
MRSKRFLLILVLLFVWLAPARVAQAADEKHSIYEDLRFSVNGGAFRVVKTIHYKYENNRYLSMRDLAAAMSGTEKTFELSVAETSVTITTGIPYQVAGGENEPFLIPEDVTDYAVTTRALRLNTITIDDRNVRYHTLIGKNDADVFDCYMSLTDVAMLLDLDLALDSEGLHLNTAGHFHMDMNALKAQGFFYEVHSALVGNATTGEIYASYEEDLSVPIASTTKLMTYLCVMDAVSDGELTLNDTVRISRNAEKMSRSADGTIPMKEGQEATVRDLLYGLLLPSSNECALALAEHICGGEAAFVERMNAKALAIGLSADAVFYNSNGLPLYTDTVAATKIQNHMSAKDMFLLVSHILKEYPEVMEITDSVKAELPSFQTSVNNTNPMIYNLPEAVGMKTGTTTMSGACLVSALEAAAPDGGKNYIVAIEFGAEDGTVRCTLSEELLLYGKQYLSEGNSGIPVTPPEEGGIPQNAEELIRAVLRNR